MKDEESTSGKINVKVGFLCQERKKIKNATQAF